MSIFKHDLLLDFLSSSVSQYHTAEKINTLLAEQGSLLLDESETWQLEPGHRYHVMRNNSSVFAFQLGKGSLAEDGFRITAAHTDSPALKPKLPPYSQSRPGDKVDSGSCLPVEVYGSPILYSWFDRQLGLAGHLTRSLNNQLEQQLFQSYDYAFTIPSLAIHMQRAVNDAFSPNPHNDIRVLLDCCGRPTSEVIADILPEDTVFSDLYLYDIQPPFMGGIKSPYISGSRLDNLLGCFTDLVAYLESPLRNYTQVAVFFDAEEIGSRTRTGADSKFLTGLLQRVFTAAGQWQPQDWYRCQNVSRGVSNDAAHALHPAHGDKHDSLYSPVINGGPVIKQSAIQRYATTSTTAANFNQHCSAVKVACQHLVNRADIPTGSTIGPFISAQTQIPFVDVGLPLLAMHSIRETAGLHDVTAMIAVLRDFYSAV